MESVTKRQLKLVLDLDEIVETVAALRREAQRLVADGQTAAAAELDALAVRFKVAWARGRAVK